MQVVLAIETSSAACSVALAHGDAIHFDHRVEPRAHNGILLGMIDGLLTEAGLRPSDLDGVAFGRGPGSFTGLRIAAAVTQGIAWGRDVPVVGVSSLQVLAATARSLAAPAEAILTLVDARMNELYWNVFEANEAVRPLADDALVAAEDLGPALEDRFGGTAATWIVAGNRELVDPLVLPEGIEGVACPDVLPDARSLLALAGPALRTGAGLPAREAIPAYLRDERRWRRMAG